MGLLAALKSVGKAIVSNIPVIGQAVDTAVSAKVQRENVDKTIAANRQLAEYQYSKDLEMWNRGNVYNAPEAQMERLKKAGLNPNLVYGSGAVGNTSGQLPQYNAPTVEYNYRPPVDFGSAIEAFQNFQVKQAQVDNLRAQATERQQVLDLLNAPIQDSYFTDTDFSSGEVVIDKWSTLRKYLAHNKAFAIGAEARRKLSPAYGVMPQYQASALKAGTDKTSAEINRIAQETLLLQKKNDYFAAQAVMGLFGSAANALGVGAKMFPSIGKGIRDAGKKGKEPVKLPPSMKKGPYWQGYKEFKRRNP